MLKNFIDYNLYLFKVKRIEIIIVFIDLALFIISTYTLIGNWEELLHDSNDNGILFVLIGTIIKFLYDLYKIICEVKDSMDLRYGYIKSDIQEKIYNEIQVDETEGNDYKIEDIVFASGKKERVLRSLSLDNYIRQNNLILEESKNMERNIKKFIKENKESLLPFLKFNYRLSNFYGKMFFNEKKLCISCDIRATDKANKVYYHKGSYYDTYLTNIIAGKEIRSNEDNKLIASAEEFMPVIRKGDEYYLKDITTSVMNNEVGISTLAITNDNYLIIWTQNRIAQSSGGLLVPTGSGSCDLADIRGNSFNDTIIYAMNRELFEENGGKLLCNSPEEIGQTKILGTFRWINKGGKSEFVGLTKVNKDLVSFAQEKKEVFDREEYLITSLDDLLKKVDELLQKDNLSVPLNVNLKVLKEYAKDNREELEEFLRLNN